MCLEFIGVSESFRKSCLNQEDTTINKAGKVGSQWWYVVCFHEVSSHTFPLFLRALYAVLF